MSAPTHTSSFSFVFSSGYHFTHFLKYRQRALADELEARLAESIGQVCEDQAFCRAQD